MNDEYVWFVSISTYIDYVLVIRPSLSPPLGITSRRSTTTELNDYPLAIPLRHTSWVALYITET
jgi:hypothetical protein